MQGGRMLCGGRKDAPLQVIDALDIGKFCVSILEQDAGGIYNVCGPERPFGWEEWLLRAKQALRAGTDLVWVDAQELEDAGCKPGADLPLYHGASTDTDAFMRTDNSRALAKGLSFTTFEDTVLNTAEWLKTRTEPPKVGMSLEREQELLAKLS